MPFFSEQERLYIVKSIKYVSEHFWHQVQNVGFKPDLQRTKPIFSLLMKKAIPRKESLCKEAGVDIIVLRVSPRRTTSPF